MSEIFKGGATDYGKIGGFKIVPVPPGHEHEPEPFHSNVDLGKGIAYVREEEWPMLKEELKNIPTRQ